jgi:hypothetical protein
MAGQQRHRYSRQTGPVYRRKSRPSSQGHAAQSQLTFGCDSLCVNSPLVTRTSRPNVSRHALAGQYYPMRLSTLFLGDSPNWGRIPKQPCNKVPKLLCTSTKARELIGFTVGVAIGMIRSMILGLVSSLNVVTLGGSCLGCWMDSRKASVTQIRQLGVLALRARRL